MRAVTLLLLAVFAMAPGAHGAPQPADSRPYDARLLRLAELLGAIHYLRELCGANEGQFWRDTMQELMKSEGSSPVRKARMTRSFNQGYRSYSRTYNVCTPSARSAIDRFLIEGAELADTLATGRQ
ncbi:MAG: TIGR02301 family protein [Hyphomicrobiaceae bacterium]